MGTPIPKGTVTHPWAPPHQQSSPQNWLNSCRRSSRSWTWVGRWWGVWVVDSVLERAKAAAPPAPVHMHKEVILLAVAT